MLEIRHNLLDRAEPYDPVRPPLCSIAVDGAFLFGLPQHRQIRYLLTSPRDLAAGYMVMLGWVSVDPEGEQLLEFYGLERQGGEVVIFSGGVSTRYESINQDERQEVVRVPFAMWESTMLALDESLIESGIPEGRVPLLPRPAAEILDELWDGKEDHKQIIVLESRSFPSEGGIPEEIALEREFLDKFEDLVHELREAWGQEEFEDEGDEDEEENRPEKVRSDEDHRRWYDAIAMADWRRGDHSAYVSLEQGDSNLPLYLLIGVCDTL